MTYEQIQAANSLIKTTKIKAKDYAEVNQRVKAFRFLYPNGRIDTDLLKFEDGLAITKTWVYDDAGNLLGTGLAYEKEGSSIFTKTSCIEVCETSSVGRALGFLGLGIDTSIASYEEVNNAKLKADGQKFASLEERRGLAATCEARGVDSEMLKTYVGFDPDKQPCLTVEQYAKAMEYLIKETE